MAAIPGSVPIAGFVAPTDSLDTYPAVDPIWGIDGLRSVANTTVRNAIVAGRRRAGMLVCTQDTFSYWRLNNSPWAFDDTDWTALSLPAAAAGADGDVQVNVSGALGVVAGFNYAAGVLGLPGTLAFTNGAFVITWEESTTYIQGSADDEIRTVVLGNDMWNVRDGYSLGGGDVLANNSVVAAGPWVDHSVAAGGSISMEYVTASGFGQFVCAGGLETIVFATTPNADHTSLTNLLVLNATVSQVLSPLVVYGSLQIDGSFSGYFAVLTPDPATTINLTDGLTGQVLFPDAATAITVNVPGTLTPGFCITVIQSGAGQVTFVGTAGLTVVNRQTQFKTAGLNAAVTLIVRSATEAVLAGDTAA